ncbi:MAG: DUF433 domain-containing protein [Bacteroidetes bacterium]|nr:DUF433 domain-containing protein [Bacteroidota bacterium]
MRKETYSDRITFNRKIFRGKPIIKGTRISVDIILGFLANDWSVEDILKQYPQLERKDILAALEYSAKRLNREEIVYETAS